MGMAGAIEAGKAYVTAYLDDNRLTRGLEALRHKLASWSAALKSIGSMAHGGELPEWMSKLMSMATSPAGIFAGLVASAKYTAEANEHLGKLADRAGISVEKFTELNYAAAGLGVSTEALGGALRGLEMRLIKAGESGAKGGKRAAAAFAGLGIDTSKIGNSADALRAIMEKFRQYDAQSQLNIAQKMGITELLPMLRAGTAAMDAYIDEARRFGLVTTKEDVEAGESFLSVMARFNVVLWDAVKQIGGALLPILTGLGRMFLEVLATVREWIKEHKALVMGLFMATAAVVVLGGALEVLGVFFRLASVAMGIYKVAVFLCKTVMVAFNIVLGVTHGLLGMLASPMLLIGAILLGLVIYVGYCFDAFTAFGTMIGEVYKDFTAAIEGIAVAIAKGDIKTAWAIVCSFMQITWENLKYALYDCWLGFREGFWNILYTIPKAFNSAVASIKIMWSDTVAWLQKKWVDFTNFDFTTKIAKAMAPITAWLEGVSEKEVLKAIDRDQKARQSGANSEKAKIDRAAEDYADQTNLELAKDNGAWDAESQKLAAEREAVRKAHEKKTAALREDMERLIDKAKEPAEDQIGDGLPKTGDKRFEMPGSASVKTVGTFSGVVAGMLGSGGFNPQLAEISGSLHLSLDQQKEANQRLGVIGANIGVPAIGG